MKNSDLEYILKKLECARDFGQCGRLSAHHMEQVIFERILKQLDDVCRIICDYMEVQEKEEA